MISMSMYDQGQAGVILPANTVHSRSSFCTMYDIYLDDAIGKPMQYREEYRVLSNASPFDIVRVHVNTPGGQLDAGIQLINHIIECEARVVGVLHAEASSMGSAIFLSCHEWQLNKFSQMMIHSCSYGTLGKQSDIQSHVQNMTRFNETFIRETYTGFLSEEEITSVLKGEDIYFGAGQPGGVEELEARLIRFSEYKEKLESGENILVEEIPKKPARKKKISEN